MTSTTHEPVSPTPSRVLTACAMFGLDPAELSRIGTQTPTEARLGAQRLDEALGAGLALVSGPSGCGKSALMSALRRDLERSGRPVIVPDAALTPEQERTPVIDLFDLPVDRTMRLLARAGLAEAMVFLSPAGSLSQGQLARLAIARAMLDAERAAPDRPRGRDEPDPVTVLMDEFCSTLDRVTAKNLCRLVRRWADQAHVRVVCAASNTDILAPLEPDILATPAFRGPTRIQRLKRAGPGHDPTADLELRPAQLRDYLKLSRFHYRIPRPATCVRVLGLFDPEGEGVGALVVSMPTLDGRWRELAWPGRYSAARCPGGRPASPARPSRAQAARRLNNEVRTISRVVIDPRWRGLGLATRLVRAYLDDPLTPATEAIAAMGPMCPFFARAGMTEYLLPPATPEARLADALHAAGAHVHHLADPQRVVHLFRTHPFTAAELQRWTRDSKTARRHAHRPPEQLAPIALAALSTRPAAYAHTKEP